MFKNLWGSQEKQAEPRSQEISTNSWYPPSVLSSPSSSRPTTPGANSSNSFSMPKPANRPNSLSNVSPAEVAGIISMLRDKSVDELRKLMSDKDAYQNLLLSLEPVKTQNTVRDELRNEILQLASENLEKETRMLELRNQCLIIQTTELANALEKLHELERRKEEIVKRYSHTSLLHELQETMKKKEEESEALHRQLLDKELDLTAFVQKYKNMRCTYHNRALTHLDNQKKAFYKSLAV